jgi:phosphatidylglycerophosphate synthase
VPRRALIPYALLFSRLVLAPVCPLVAWRCSPPTAGVLLVGIFAWAILSDIFDGILARRWGVSTAGMRRWDSSVDTVFWISAVGTLLALHRAWFWGRWPWVAVVLGLEAATYLVSWLRFGREPATHSLGAKIFALVLVAFLCEVALTGNGHVLWWPCVLGALAVRVEVLAILFVLPAWTNDVPHLGAALRLRRGLDIRRHRLFNG